jgi:hypothetical protein
MTEKLQETVLRPEAERKSAFSSDNNRHSRNAMRDEMEKGEPRKRERERERERERLTVQNSG